MTCRGCYLLWPPRCFQQPLLRTETGTDSRRKVRDAHGGFRHVHALTTCTSKCSSCCDVDGWVGLAQIDVQKNDLKKHGLLSILGWAGLGWVNHTQTFLFWFSLPAANWISEENLHLKLLLEKKPVQLEISKRHLTLAWFPLSAQSGATAPRCPGHPLAKPQLQQTKFDA